MSILQTKNLTKKFDAIKAVDHLSIELEKGKITAIIGPNGSGKTTLINALTGMLPLSGGSVSIGGTNLEKIKPHEISDYGLTRTFQDVRLFEQMTVLDNILVVLTERNLSGSIFEKHGQHHLDEAKEVLKKVGLWEKEKELAYNLSYGQRKLLEIARALAMKSEILLLDEPFSGLFPEMVKVATSIIKKLKDGGKTIVLIEHDMNLIRQLSDYIFVMDSGKLLAEGKPEEVLKRKEVIKAYLGD